MMGKISDGAVMRLNWERSGMPCKFFSHLVSIYITICDGSPQKIANIKMTTRPQYLSNLTEYSGSFSLCWDYSQESLSYCEAKRILLERQFVSIPGNKRGLLLMPPLGSGVSCSPRIDIYSDQITCTMLRQSTKPLAGTTTQLDDPIHRDFVQHLHRYGSGRRYLVYVLFAPDWTALKIRQHGRRYTTPTGLRDLRGTRQGLLRHKTPNGRAMRQSFPPRSSTIVFPGQQRYADTLTRSA